MKTGISTASLFIREYNEDALKTLNEMKVETTEIFLSTFSEYKKEFGEVLLKRKGNIDVHSMHVATTQFEPQLFGLHPRAREDAFFLLENVLQSGQMLGAKYYTLHGISRLKKSPLMIDYNKIGEQARDISDTCKKYGITLCFENVHWSYYNYLGFYTNLKKECPAVRGVLDIKQAFYNEIPYEKFLEEMGNDIVTVHISDRKEDGTLCLPGKGIFDFDLLFKRLKDVGFDGAVLIEAYKNDYNSLEELKESYEFIKEKTYKIF